MAKLEVPTGWSSGQPQKKICEFLLAVFLLNRQDLAKQFCGKRCVVSWTTRVTQLGLAQSSPVLWPNDWIVLIPGCLMEHVTPKWKNTCSEHRQGCCLCRLHGFQQTFAFFPGTTIDHQLIALAKLQRAKLPVPIAHEEPWRLGTWSAVQHQPAMDRN